jgi:hypothetical protein
MQIEAAMMAAGFTEANGFAFPELIAYRDAMRDLVREETRHMVEASSRLGAEEAIALVEQGMPIIDELVRFFHQRAILESIARWRSLLYVKWLPFGWGSPSWTSPPWRRAISRQR